MIMQNTGSPLWATGNAPIRDDVSSIERQQILAVAEVGEGIEDVIGLWYGESDLTTPKFICDAAAQALAEGDTFYSIKRGVPELRDALAEYCQDLYGTQISSDRISLTASGMSAIMMVFQMLIEKGDNVIIVSPVWPNAQSAVRVMGAEPRFVSLTATDAGFALDLEALYAAVDENTKAIFINSPNNPTGWVMPAEQQKDILAFCRDRGIWIISDEVYARMVYDGRAAPSFLDHAKANDPLLVVNSFSKSWAMTGWRIGWLVHPPAIGDLLGNVVEFNYSCLPLFLQKAALVAVKEGEAFVQNMNEHCRRGRDILEQRLPSMPRIKGYKTPEASFYAFFQIDNGGDDTLARAQDLVRKAKLGIAPGSAFGPGAETWYRLCFAQSPERLSDAMDRLETYLNTQLS